MELGKMVLIEWVDSKVMHGWRNEDEVFEDTLANCRTIGFLQYEDSDLITLVMGVSDCGTILETVTTPQGCITRMRELRCK